MDPRISYLITHHTALIMNNRIFDYVKFSNLARAAFLLIVISPSASVAFSITNNLGRDAVFWVTPRVWSHDNPPIFSKLLAPGETYVCEESVYYCSNDTMRIYLKMYENRLDDGACWASNRDLVKVKSQDNIEFSYKMEAALTFAHIKITDGSAHVTYDGKARGFYKGSSTHQKFKSAPLCAESSVN